MKVIASEGLSGRLYLKGIVVGLCLVYAGCAPLRTPIIAPAHPARPQATNEGIVEVPEILDVARATRRDPNAREGTMLHPDTPMNHQMPEQPEGRPKEGHQHGGS